jgi:signal transduction histidine kinase
MKGWPLAHRLWAVFAALLLVCCAASVALQMLARTWHEQEVVQRLSRGLAAHMADHSGLATPGARQPDAVRALFEQLMVVNPSVEVYLLDSAGAIRAEAAPPGRLRRERVDLSPIRSLFAGQPLPIFGDDPRSDDGRKVFDAAPVPMEGGQTGFLYVVLLGEAHDALTAQASLDNMRRTTLWGMATVATLGLIAGVLALRWVIRPLRRLTDEVDRFDPHGPPTEVDADETTTPDGRGDEIATLRQAFARMRRRIAEQWHELQVQDRQRRELVANISHDLRTPLTSLHGYLETLKVKAGTLSEEDRGRYLDIALGQSRKVGRLAQELFELARLECGAVRPEPERFSLAELVQDVLQKFELPAQQRRLRLVADIAPALPRVEADLGMMERVLTNLLDNAVRHTPEGGTVEVRLRPEPAGVEVLVSDSGPGVTPALQQHLFQRPLERGPGYEVAGGLGLVVVRRILQLHGSDIRLLPPGGLGGAVFRFRLAATALTNP